MVTADKGRESPRRQLVMAEKGRDLTRLWHVRPGKGNSRDPSTRPNKNQDLTQQTMTSTRFHLRRRAQNSRADSYSNTGNSSASTTSFHRYHHGASRSAGREPDSGN
ncbi:hypothetical protein Bca4012_064598 [Brassica carinata]